MSVTQIEEKKEGKMRERHREKVKERDEKKKEGDYEKMPPTSPRIC